MTEILIDAPADAAQREAALDIRRSIIVQAPAGSGKTDLLTRRYLRLLAAVDEPEEILAITFTRAATAEMRSRILRDLEAAAGRRRYDPGEDDARMELARAALAHAERRGWNLFEHPQRLAIETIDSLCLRIAHDRPLLARLGGHFQPIEEAEPLYALAARRTLELLGGPDAVLDQALAQLLDLRDNQLSGCQSLIAEMLKVRDQWQDAFPLSREMGEEDWELLRQRLEAPFRREIRRVLTGTCHLLSAEPIHRELLELAHYACDQGNEKVALLAGVPSLSGSMPVEHWRCITDFLLTTDGDWRRSFRAPDGFPTEKRGGPAAKRAKEKMEFLQARLRQIPQLHDALRSIRRLPPATYTESQWTTLRSVFTVLRQAVAELRVVFAEHNQVDFTELSLAAVDVLRHSPDRVLDIAGNVRHLLIDEFQDTSRRQHQLACALLAAWDPGPENFQERTTFLVGDPMQSIYMFRQAEVELFALVRDHGIGPEGGRIRCDPVQLSVNFRSHAGLTEPINEMFDLICTADAPPGAASVPFARATSAPAPDAPLASALHIHPQIIGSGDRTVTLADIAAALRQEAEEVLQILERHLPHIERARASGGEYRVAILVRARTHLAQIVPLLRERRIPFRAVEIERLSERQELLDLRALTRTLLHPMDRIAWLSALRAPWCGLTLSDLHTLIGSDDPAFRNLSVIELIDLRRSLLSPDGQQRLARTAEILRRALDLRWRQSESPSFASWIERTWRTLGGPACIDAAAHENVQVFFSMLDSVAPDGLDASAASFDAEFDRLFAQPDPAVSERCGIQLMTIHKAKGLGFDVVIVPGLDRKSSGDPNPLVTSLERMNPWSSENAPGENEFLVAPIGLQGESTEPLYKWVVKQRQIRFDEERKRLLYVACTRARRELHLLGTAVAKRAGVSCSSKDSLLATAWPALRSRFETAQREPQRTPVAEPARILTFPALSPAAVGTPGILDRIAAAAGPSPLILRRLALDAEPAIPSAQNVTVTGSFSIADADEPEFQRREGARESRIIGSTVHELLERPGPELARLDAAQLRSRVSSLLRAAALTGESLKSVTEAVTKMLLACAADPVCQWILAAHPGAQSEASWTGVGDSGSRLRTLRADRVFRAGPAPLDSSSSDYLWVIDYKTGSVAPGALLLASERALYAPQLLAYARALRALHGPETKLRLGLYYAAIPALDWWDPDRE
jgi:ATP-dependent exoDNAse (exonuclease V) beta subunit